MNNDVTINWASRLVSSATKKAGSMANTGEKALKGARLKKVQRYITGDTFMVTYGDGVADIDLHALVAFHRSHGKLATVSGINVASRFGELKVEGDQVVAFSEKPEVASGLISGGYFVFNRGVFDYVSDDDACDLEIGALEEIARSGQLMVYKHPGFWACMDTLRDMDYLNQLWVERKATWKVW
jgi:glucose-1-phosphate cytidylyltransferase